MKDRAKRVAKSTEGRAAVQQGKTDIGDRRTERDQAAEDAHHSSE